MIITAISVRNCARCKGDHESLEVVRMTEAVTLAAPGQLMTADSMAICPSTKLPIYASFLDDARRVADAPPLPSAPASEVEESIDDLIEAPS